MQGPALTSVTGTTWPSALNTCVMPIFLPRIPGLILLPTFGSLRTAALFHFYPSARSQTRGRILPTLRFLPKCFDFDVYAGGKIQLHQRIHGFLSGFEDIEQALMRADFKLFPRFFVYVRRT